MSYRIALPLLALWVVTPVGAQPRNDQAQVQAHVMVISDNVGQEALQIVADALARDGIALARAQAAPVCQGGIAQAPARVWVRWTPGERSTVVLCFQAACRSAERQLGPFAMLDARAREELITVIESGLEALQHSCASEAADRDAIAHRTPSAAESSTHALDLQPGPPAQEGQPGGLAGSNAAEGGSAPQPPSPLSIPTDLSTTEPSPSAADELVEAARARVAFGASLGLQRWTPEVVSQQLSAYAAYAVHRLPAYVGLEFAYTSRFRAQSGELSLDASCVRLALQLWARVKLTESWSLDVRLGPALEWLSLAPEAATARLIEGALSSVHADPLWFARLGPALRVYSALVVGAEAQLDAAWIQRSFGFASAAGPRNVFVPDRIRLSLLVNARVEL